MGRKSRLKGVKGEREVARKLYEAWMGIPPPPDREIFVRTKIGVRQSLGDIVVPPDFPYLVEVKNRPIALKSVVEFTGQFRRLIDETVTKLWNGEKGICLAVRVGKPSSFHYFIITDSSHSIQKGWVRELDDGLFIYWLTENEFLSLLKLRA